MTVLQQNVGIATSDGTTEVALPAAAGVPPRGVRIDVDELSRRVGFVGTLE